MIHAGSNNQDPKYKVNKITGVRVCVSVLDGCDVTLYLHSSYSFDRPRLPSQVKCTPIPRPAQLKYSKNPT